MGSIAPQSNARPQAPGSQARGPKPPGAAGAIQRQVLNQEGVVRTTNLAEKQIQGSNSLGFTPPWVNNMILGDGKTRHDLAAALNKPTIEVNQVGENRYEAVVKGVPTNHVGHMMYLPMPPPWRATGRKSALLPLMSVYDDQVGEIDLQIVGATTDQALAQQVERHEDVHAADILRIKKAILIPWDARLQNAFKSREPFVGRTAEEARGALYAAMGGTPEEIADRLFESWDRASRDFHESGRGRVNMDNSKTGVNHNHTLVTIAYSLPI